jgi:hypothetical protein
VSVRAASKAYEAGYPAGRDREFEGVGQAEAAHDSPGCQDALKVLGNGIDRNLRIIEGV